MSKERELLQKVVNHMWQGELVDEIKEVLAQPEQDTFGSYLLVGRKEAIAELILCMRFSNENDLAQAVLDYIEGLTRANREKRNEK